MSLNLKNDEAHRLAQELSALTGESMTTAATVAMRERLQRLRGAKRVSMAERLLAIGRDCAPRLKGRYRKIEHGDLLYDHRGLPR
jgi:antitoxin VapB